ncbi:hypothetical protein KC799_21355 [candidate division KSB1 bacterium]|nr:hypothetical protein [candidate division KSB1 bacterium]
MSIRRVKRLVKAKPTIEDAGVNLRLAFGFGDPGGRAGLLKKGIHS